MNRVCLVGNLARDPQMRQAGGVDCCTFTVAVSRPYRGKDGTQDTDFITCVAWRERAAFVHRYFHKGSAIGVTGSIQTRSYDDDKGQRHWVTEVSADSVEFVGNKVRDNGPQGYAPSAPAQTAPGQSAPKQRETVPSPVGPVEPEAYEDLSNAELPF